MDYDPLIFSCILTPAHFSYHNLMGVADYGSLGHGEVVSLNVPRNKVQDFATEYFQLFGSDSERPDKGDRGGEYRSLLGLPGGSSNPDFANIQAALDKSGKKLKLVDGRGDDKDTLGKGIVYVMDSSKFPFYPGEIYHQFHDGFMPGEQYPQTYNDLARLSFAQKRIALTGCPDSIPR